MRSVYTPIMGRACLELRAVGHEFTHFWSVRHQDLASLKQVPYSAPWPRRPPAATIWKACTYIK
jgi:hypothetical protein